MSAAPVILAVTEPVFLPPSIRRPRRLLRICRKERVIYNARSTYLRRGTRVSPCRNPEKRLGAQQYRKCLTTGSRLPARKETEPGSSSHKVIRLPALSGYKIIIRFLIDIYDFLYTYLIQSRYVAVPVGIDIFRAVNKQSVVLVHVSRDIADQITQSFSLL